MTLAILITLPTLSFDHFIRSSCNAISEALVATGSVRAKDTLSTYTKTRWRFVVGNPPLTVNSGNRHAKAGAHSGSYSSTVYLGAANQRRPNQLPIPSKCSREFCRRSCQLHRFEDAGATHVVGMQVLYTLPTF